MTEHCLWMKKKVIVESQLFVGKKILFLFFEVKESFAIHISAVRYSMSGPTFPKIHYLKTLEEVL